MVGALSENPCTSYEFLSADDVDSTRENLKLMEYAIVRIREALTAKRLENERARTLMIDTKREYAMRKNLRRSRSIAPLWVCCGCCIASLSLLVRSLLNSPPL